MSQTTGNSNQAISLPKGGGAPHCIGEKFSPDVHAGISYFTRPNVLPPGQNGFQPSLDLVSNTRNGNGPFGFGLSLSNLGVSRKTFKRIPPFVIIYSGRISQWPV